MYLPDDYIFTDQTKIKVQRAKSQIFNWYRNVHIAMDKVTVLGSGYEFLLFADNYLFGAFSVRLNQGKDGVLMVADFVMTRNHFRLSKLVIMLARSEEVKLFIASQTGRLFKKMDTIVYTSSSVSMKYRGEYKKVRTRLNKSTKEIEALTYQADLGKLSMDEEYQEWLTKHYAKRK